MSKPFYKTNGGIVFIVLLFLGGLYGVRGIISDVKPSNSPAVNDSVSRLSNQDAMKIVNAMEDSVRISRFINVRETLNDWLKTESKWNIALDAADKIMHDLTADTSQTRMNKNLHLFEVAVFSKIPTFRHQYVDEISDKYWRDNIKAKCAGSNCDVMVMTGGFFANNGYCQDWHNEHRADLSRLGFRKVEYYWVDGADGISIKVD